MTPEQAIDALLNAHAALSKALRGVACDNIKDDLRKLRNVTDALQSEVEMHL